MWGEAAGDGVYGVFRQKLNHVTVTVCKGERNTVAMSG